MHYQAAAATRTHAASLHALQYAVLSQYAALLLHHVAAHHHKCAALLHKCAVLHHVAAHHQNNAATKSIWMVLVNSAILTGLCESIPVHTKVILTQQPLNLQLGEEENVIPEKSPS